jgi:hypothetical protein
VLFGLGAVLVRGRVDGRDSEAAGRDVAVGASSEAGCLLVLAAAVTEQHKRAAGGGSRGFPEHAGDVAEGEQSFRDAVAVTVTQNEFMKPIGW